MQDQLLSTRMGKYLESAYQNLLLIGNACLTNAQTALKLHIFQVGPVHICSSINEFWVSI